MADGYITFRRSDGTGVQRVKTVDVGDADGAQALATTATIGSADIQIGAVELKDADAATRARIAAANASHDANTPVIVVQPVDASGQVIDTFATTDLTYTTRIDKPDENTTYIGKALPGAVESAYEWQVIRITKSGTVTAIQFAEGTEIFDKRWTDRASMIYS